MLSQNSGDEPFTLTDAQSPGLARAQADAAALAVELGVLKYQTPDFARSWDGFEREDAAAEDELVAA